MLHLKTSHICLFMAISNSFIFKASFKTHNTHNIYEQQKPVNTRNKVLQGEVTVLL